MTLAIAVAAYDDPDSVRFVDAVQTPVDPAHRRRGLAGAVLAELERSAAADGCARTVLETGDQQPEAIAFYRDAGYTDIPRFGVYRREAGSLCLARELARARADGPGPGPRHVPADGPDSVPPWRAR